MLPVYICEDEDIQVKSMEKMIENQIIIENMDMKIVCVATKPTKILEYLKMHTEIGLYFLDIDLKADINGIELAYEIRKIDPWGFIVFFTTHEEMIPLTYRYQVSAMDYIMKDHSEDFTRRIHSNMKCALQRHRVSNEKVHDILNINAYDHVMTVQKNEIFFIESINLSHRIMIHFQNSFVEISSSLKEISSNLDQRFFRCNKSYIVNLHHIRECNKMTNRITLNNNQVLYCSYRKRKTLMQKLELLQKNEE